MMSDLLHQALHINLHWLIESIDFNAEKTT